MGTTLAIGCAALLLAGCAHRPVSIDSRPTPHQPDSSSYDTSPPRPTPAKRPASLLTQTVRDTASAGARLRRCKGRKLLPEDESVWESTARLLDDTRAALLRGDLGRARSLARNARQLSTSLTCR
jgi:hypothetical protein